MDILPFSSPRLPWLTVARIQLATAFSCAMIVTGLYTVPFFRILSSIGIICLLATALTYLLTYRQVAQHRKWLVYAGFIGIFLMHLLAGLNTDAANKQEFIRDLTLQSAFLTLPLSFWILPPLPTVSIGRLYRLLLTLTTLSAIGSTVFYLLNNERIDESYIHSKVMPTVPDHIRFSLLIALSIAVGAVLLNRKKLQGWRRSLVLIATIFLAGFLHLLAVRSGLLAFNLLALVAVLYLLRRRQWQKAAAVVALLVVLPVVSYRIFPTYHNKFHNTQEDASRVEHTQSANNYSLVGRVYSYQIALEVIKDYPLVGVGKADLQQEISKYYERLYPQINREHHIKPHNQFLYHLVAFGILGTGFFTLCFFYPLWWARYRRAPLLMAQYIIVSTSFVAEYTLESQTGLVFSLFYLLLPLSSMEATKAEEGARVGPEWRPA